MEFFCALVRNVYVFTRSLQNLRKYTKPQLVQLVLKNGTVLETVLSSEYKLVSVHESLSLHLLIHRTITELTAFAFVSYNFFLPKM